VYYGQSHSRFPIQSQALFRLETIPASLFRSKRLGRSVHVYPYGDNYFRASRAGDESAIGEHVFIYNLGRVTLGRVSRSRIARIFAGNTRSYQAGFSAAASADCDWLRRVDLCGCVCKAPGVTVAREQLLVHEQLR